MFPRGLWAVRQAPSRTILIGRLCLAVSLRRFHCPFLVAPIRGLLTNGIWDPSRVRYGGPLEPRVLNPGLSSGTSPRSNSAFFNGLLMDAVRARCLTLK